MTRKSAALAGALTIAAGVAPPIAYGQMVRPAQALSGFQLARPSQIGVTVHDGTPGDAKDSAPGVVVDEVQDNSPAARAGLKSGDRIVEYDGDRVRSVRQFSRVVQETAPDRTVAVVVTRGDQRLTVNVTPEPSSDFGLRLLQGPAVWSTLTPPPAPRAPRAVPVVPAVPFRFEGFGRPARFGVSIESLNGQLAAYFGVKDGVLVDSVVDGSTAAKAGLKAGDVITAINGDHVAELSDVPRTLARLDSGAAVTIEIVRDRKALTLKGTLERGSELRYRTRP